MTSLLRFFQQRPLFSDALLAAALTGVAVAVAFGVSGSGSEISVVPRPDHPLEWALIVTPSICIAMRRLLPVTAVAFGSTAIILIWLLGLPDFVISGAILIYSAVIYGTRPHGRVAAGLAAAALSLMTLTGVLVGEAPFYVLPLVILTTFTAFVLGVNTETRQAYILEVERRAQVAELHQAASDEALLQGERNRIARELHDVVAHGLGVIVVQAGAGRRILAQDPDGAASALHQIEKTGRQSLGEMRQMLGILRTDAADQGRPTPGLGELEELVDSYVASGLVVSSEQVGHRTELPATINTSAYRIVQEALTNCLKHGGPHVEVFVQVSYEPNAVDIRVMDNGRGGAATATSGQGLKGMKERVEVFGGSLRTGPRPGGGFEVAARLPLQAVDV